MQAVMLKKTFPFLRGTDPLAYYKANKLAQSIFAVANGVRIEDVGRVTATSQGNWFFCRTRGPASGMKDYEWSAEITVGEMVIRPGVYRGCVGKAADDAVETPQHEAEAQQADGRK